MLSKHDLTHYHTLTIYCKDTHFDASTTDLENIVEKGEIARNEQFILFPQCFLLNHINVSPFVHIFHIINYLIYLLLNLKSEIGISGKELSHPRLTSAELQ